MADKEPRTLTKETPTTSRQAWYMVSVLALAYTFSFLDRQILSLLVGEIQADLHINDTQMGVLHGFTFAVFYTIAGLPIARAIDLRPRRAILAAGIFAWSLATALCGIATRYWHLLLLRTGVAVGEATLMPAMTSLISDSFPPHKRGIATGIFQLGLPIGIGLSVLAGGVLLNLLSGWQIDVPFFGTLKTWQAVFVAVGLPGIIVAALALTIVEPARDQFGPKVQTTEATPTVRDVVDFMISTRNTLGWHFIAVGMSAMAGYGFITWIPTFLVRTHGWTFGDVGIIYGGITIAAGVASTLLFGWLADRRVGNGDRHGKIRAAIIACSLCFVPALLFPIVPSNALALLFLTLYLGTAYGIYAVTPAVLQDEVPAAMRGQITAVYQGVVNLIGLGLGPTGVGFITDYVFGDPNAIGYALAIIALIGYASAIAAWFVYLRNYERVPDAAKASA